MKPQKGMDLTTGSPLRQLLIFSLPLVAGTLFQQLYSFMDTVMVGRLIGENALAAVGATYSLNFLILGFIQGSCVGFTIPLAQEVGAQNAGEFKRYFWNACLLCVGMSLLLTLGTLAAAGPLLSWLDTPAEIQQDALLYIRIIFAGIPVTVLYNFCSGTLRAAGDSRRPLYFLVFSSFLNILLDYLWLAVFPLGVAGAAMATVLSQLVSGLLCLGWLAARTDLLAESAGLRRPSGRRLGRLCRIGFPMGFEYSISALGAVVLQNAINRLGTVAVAGQTAGEKIRQMFTLPMESVGMGMATYAGQNDGAGRTDRIRAGIRAGITIQLLYCVFAWGMIFLGKEAFTAFVLGADYGEAGQLSVQYLGIISLLFCFHGCLMILRNTLQGMGYSIQAVLSGVGELAGRSLGSFLSVWRLGFIGICLANPLSWLFALLYCSVMVRHYLKKRG